LTLPTDIIERLSSRDGDLSQAIVGLLGERAASSPRAVDTLATARRQSLITVNPAVMPLLPGCVFMRISADRAFIALEPGAGLSDLELAVGDRMHDADITPEQRKALRTFRTTLKKWRLDKRIAAQQRAIVVLEEQK
jgi:hypothetical protein